MTRQARLGGDVSARPGCRHLQSVVNFVETPNTPILQYSNTPTRRHADPFPPQRCMIELKGEYPSPTYGLGG
jgi:hypothetical protein